MDGKLAHHLYEEWYSKVRTAMNGIGSTFTWYQIVANSGTNADHYHMDAFQSPLRLAIFLQNSLINIF